MSIPEEPRNLSRMKNLNVRLPKRSTLADRRAVEASVRGQQRDLVPPPVREQALGLKVSPLRTVDLARMVRANRQRVSPHTYLVESEKLDLERLSGIFYAALIAHRFQLARARCEVARAKARTPAQVKTLDANWRRLVAAFGGALRAAGVDGADEPSLARMVKQLQADPDAFNGFVAIYEGRTKADSVPSARRVAATVQAGSSVVATGKVIDIDLVVPPNWCGLDPIKGVFTKHWSQHFRLRECITYPCDLDCDFDWFNSSCDVDWCTDCFTLLEGDVSFSLEVGYKIDCCGAAAWGSASAQACATIATFEVCAGCTAGVTAVVGAGRASTTANMCTYGLGATISYECWIGDYTVSAGAIPFGWVVYGPCPPAGLCP